MPKIMLGLKNKVKLVVSPQGGAELHYGYKTVPFQVAPDTLKTLLRLAEGGMAWEELITGLEEPVRSDLFEHLDLLSKLGCLVWSLEDAGRCVARLLAIGRGYTTHPTPIKAEQRFVLSRFAYSRRLGHLTVIETAFKPIRLELADSIGGVLWVKLAQPLNSLELVSAMPETDPALVITLLQLFYAAGLIQAVNDEAMNTSEDQDPVLQQWEFHDLLFHSRTRSGRHDQPMGDTFLFWPKIPPLPACKPPMQGEVIQLAQPDLERLLEEDYPLTLILEERRSILDYGPKAITIEQIGEFLYRTARVKRIRPINLQVGAAYESSCRPYPGVGSCYELEIYLTVRESRGLAPGLYHYNPNAHHLTRLSQANEITELILKQADSSADRSCKPQVVITFTARFSRVAWKYSSTAYSLILKDVGVLFQTMYLVATAMDLAPCALDTGHADLLCQAAGLDYLEESPVGEFLLGSKRIG